MTQSKAKATQPALSVNEWGVNDVSALIEMRSQGRFTLSAKDAQAVLEGLSKLGEQTITTKTVAETSDHLVETGVIQYRRLTSDPTDGPLQLQPGYIPCTDLETLLYSMRNSEQILKDRGVSYRRVYGARIVLPGSIEIEIAYKSTADLQAQKRFHCGEFIRLAWADRRQRTKNYRVEIVEDGVALATHLYRAEAQTYSIWIEGEESQFPGQVRCSCPDYANQFHLLRQHPALWHWIGYQPRCKHILATAQALGRGDLFSIPELASQEEAT